MSLLILSHSQLSLIRVIPGPMWQPAVQIGWWPGALGSHLATIWHLRMKPTCRWADKKDGENPSLRDIIEFLDQTMPNLANPLTFQCHVPEYFIFLLNSIWIGYCFLKMNPRDLRLNHSWGTTFKTRAGQLWGLSAILFTPARVLEWHNT